MPSWIRQLQQHWVAVVGDGRPPVPFLVRCACGQPIQGQRAPTAQTVRCPNCRGPVFVLARSPLPALGEDGIPVPPPPATWQPWVVPLAAGAATLLLVGVGFTWIMIALLSPPATSQSTEKPPVTAEEIRNRAARGKRLLAEGSFREANKHYLDANEMRQGAPHLLSPAETRQFQQQMRQADLLAHLLSATLEEVIHDGQRSRPDEWQEQFKEFRGRAVCFDDVVLRDGDGHRLSVYRVRSAGETARVELKLDLLDRLDLTVPKRVLFGARLASVQRGADRVWVIRFEPGSGVLLTDEGAVSACGLPLDARMKALLREQADWVEKNP